MTMCSTYRDSEWVGDSLSENQCCPYLLPYHNLGVHFWGPEGLEKEFKVSCQVSKAARTYAMSGWSEGLLVGASKRSFCSLGPTAQAMAGSEPRGPSVTHLSQTCPPRRETRRNKGYWLLQDYSHTCEDTQSRITDGGVANKALGAWQVGTSPKN